MNDISLNRMRDEGGLAERKQGIKKMIMRGIYRVLLVTLVLSLLMSYVYAEQSVITESEGYSCMGEEKSRKQTKEEALFEAKRKAVEFTITYIKSETEIKNFQLMKDIIAAYSQAEVKVLEMRELGWYKDEYSGDCYKVKIKAEILPDDKVIERLNRDRTVKDGPTAPLNVQVWTDKEEYKNKENIKIYIKANKPFYGRVVCREENGKVIQLLPNPYRTNCYFNGGVIYEIPSQDDKFELEVTPPFGVDHVILYGSTAKLGQIDLETSGAVYKVNTKFGNIGKKTRGVTIKEKGNDHKTHAEFSESSTNIRTLGTRIK